LTRNRRLGVWAAAGAAALVVLLYLHFVPLRADGDASLCASRRVFNFSCPGCGLTRAIGALAQADLRRAWNFHPLGGFFLLEAALIWIGWGLVLAGYLTHPSTRLINQWLYLQLALLLAVWFLRLGTGTLPH
jgi:hypothetical protein